MAGWKPSQQLTRKMQVRLLLHGSLTKLRKTLLYPFLRCVYIYIYRCRFAKKISSSPIKRQTKEESLILEIYSKFDSDVFGAWALYSMKGTALDSAESFPPTQIAAVTVQCPEGLGQSSPPGLLFGSSIRKRAPPTSVGLGVWNITPGNEVRK